MSQSGSSDDNALWEQVAKTVTPANRDDVLVQTSKKSAKKTLAKKQPKPKAANPAIARPVVKTLVNPADLRFDKPAFRAGIDNASAKRLTRGSFVIDETIDLHGQTEVQAHKALLHFVQQAVRGGARTLLIITGKGAMGKGVLRRKVPDWLKDYPLKSHVLAISQASAKDGGGGALYVRLRRQRERS